MINVTAEVDGVVLVNRTLSRFGELLRDMRQLWPAVIVTVRAILKEQFTGQGVGQTGKWKPLSPAYARWKEKNFPGKPILQRTGDTFEALTKRTTESIVLPLPNTLEFGVALPYPIHHQRGGTRLPRRRIFDFNEAQKRRITKAIQVRLVSAGRDNGITLS